jgi:hypothetical protein
VVKHLEVERVKWWKWSALNRKYRRRTLTCNVLRNIEFREMSLMLRNVIEKMTIKWGTFNNILKNVRIVCFVDRTSLYNLVNKSNLKHNFSYYVYFFSLRVSDDYVPIIRRNNCDYATLGTCYSVWMTVWLDTHCLSTPNAVSTVRAPDDGHGICPKHVERLTGNNKVLYSVILLEFFEIKILVLGEGSELATPVDLTPS